MEHASRLLPYILAAFLWIYVSSVDGQVLKKAENLSLFQFDLQFMRQGLSVPGGMLGWAGAFFTQFLHFPWIGSLLWIILLLLSARLTAKSLQLPDWLSALAYIPAVTIIVFNLSLGYGMFIMREQDYFFSTVLGYLFALIPLLYEKRLSAPWKILLFRTLWITVGFILTGSYALVGVLAALLAGVRRKEFAVSGITALLLILIPLALYSLYTTYRLPGTMLAGMPQISVGQWENKVNIHMYILLAYLPLSALVPFGRIHQPAPTPGLLVNIGCYILLAIAVGIMHYGEITFRTELAMSQAIDNLEWERAVDIFNQTAKKHEKSNAKVYESLRRELKEASAQDRDEIILKYSKKYYEPTRIMVLYRDLALIKLDRALNEAFTLKDGYHEPKAITPIPIAHQAGKQLYFHYGVENICYRWCFEDIVECGLSVNALRYMAMEAIVTHEWNLAAKYLDQLDKTLFYRKWAKSQKELLYKPDIVDSTAPYSHIRKLMCQEEHMSFDKGLAEVYLMHQFMTEMPQVTTPEYDKVALFWTMRALDIPRFWYRLGKYLESNRVKSLPKHVQEAVVLYNSMMEKPVSYPVSQQTADEFVAFQKYASFNPVRSIEESRYPYEQKYGHSFYFFYLFIRDIAGY